MKYFFFLILLANIVFFLWEMQQGGLNIAPHKQSQPARQEKQILLVSERPEFNKTVAALTRASKQSRLQNKTASLASVKHGVNFHKQQQKSEYQKSFDKKSLKDLADVSITEITVVQAGPAKAIAPLTQKTRVLDAKSSMKRSAATRAPKVQEKVPVQQKFDAHIVRYYQHKKAESQTLSVAAEKNTLHTGPTGATRHDESFCVEVGPLPKPVELQNWSRQADIMADSFKLYVREVNQIGSYLVYYPAAASFSESKKNVTLLIDKGAEDIWLFRSGPQKGDISLGLFKKEYRALKLQKIFLSKGLNVLIKPRHKLQKQIYAQLTWRTSKNRQQVTAKLRQKFSPPTYQIRQNCRAI